MSEMGPHRNSDRKVVYPFRHWLWGFMGSMQQLPPYEGTMVNRGVKADIADQYLSGRFRLVIVIGYD